MAKPWPNLIYIFSDIYIALSLLFSYLSIISLVFHFIKIYVSRAQDNRPRVHLRQALFRSLHQPQLPQTRSNVLEWLCQQIGVQSLPRRMQQGQVVGDIDPHLW